MLPDEPPDVNEPIVAVWQQEDPLINLLITPHSAFYTEQSQKEMRVKAAQEVRRILLGEKPHNVVNREFLKK